MLHSKQRPMNLLFMAIEALLLKIKLLTLILSKDLHKQ